LEFYRIKLCQALSYWVDLPRYVVEGGGWWADLTGIDRRRRMIFMKDKLQETKSQT